MDPRLATPARIVRAPFGAALLICCSNFAFRSFVDLAAGDGDVFLFPEDIAAVAVGRTGTWKAWAPSNTNRD